MQNSISAKNDRHESRNNESETIRENKNEITTCETKSVISHGINSSSINSFALTVRKKN